MSIIYDALQKTQRNRSMKRDIETVPVARLRLIDKVLLLIVVLLSAIVLYTYLPSMIKPTSHAAAQKPVITTAKVQPAGLVLNGVLMSDQTQTALINNQFYHLGDSVNGMKIVSIELNNVRLQDGDTFVSLKTAT